jgi:hypothetical protein
MQQQYGCGSILAAHQGPMQCLFSIGCVPQPYFLLDAATPNAFICRPVATKDIWSCVLEFHCLTLSGCFVIDGTLNANINFLDCMVEMEDCYNKDTPLHHHASLLTLHLKLVIYHQNCL